MNEQELKSIANASGYLALLRLALAKGEFERVFGPTDNWESWRENLKKNIEELSAILHKHDAENPARGELSE